MLTLHASMLTLYASVLTLYASSLCSSLCEAEETTGMVKWHMTLPPAFMMSLRLQCVSVTMKRIVCQSDFSDVTLAQAMLHAVQLQLLSFDAAATNRQLWASGFPQKWSSFRSAFSFMKHISYGGAGSAHGQEGSRVCA